MLIVNLYNLSPFSSKSKEEQKDFKYNYNDKKIQNLVHSRKFIIEKKCHNGLFAKANSLEKFPKGSFAKVYSQNFAVF